MSASSSTILKLPDQKTATLPKRNYLNNEDGLLSWLLTGDHKRIAILYLISITFFFFIGGAFAGVQQKKKSLRRVAQRRIINKLNQKFFLFVAVRSKLGSNGPSKAEL